MRHFLGFGIVLAIFGFDKNLEVLAFSY